MPKALPPNPHIDWLKKAAKEQLAALRAHDASAKLHQAQLLVANDYGFPSWRALKARVDALSLDGQIIAAAKDGRARDLDQLLAQHPHKIAVTGEQWNRPLLHIAAGEGHLDCVDVLLRRGFDVGTRDKLDNATALHWAAQSGAVAVVARLIEAGADVDDEGDAHQIGAIGWATCFKQVRREAADYLLARGAKPTIFAAVALDRVDLVRKLVADDPTLPRTRKMSRFEHYRTPLHLAVLKNRPQMVELLLELGADAAAEDGRGYTPLALATPTTNQAIVATLIAAGADPKEQRVNRFELVVPILPVRNISAAIDYYVDKLGFQKKWEWGDPPDFACVARDQVELFLSLRASDVPGAWLSIFVQDVDALYQTYKRSGAIVREPPADYPWGIREMTIEDPTATACAWAATAGLKAAPTIERLLYVPDAVQRAVAAGSSGGPRQRPNISQVYALRSKMAIGSLVVISDGNRKFRAIGEINRPLSFRASTFPRPTLSGTLRWSRLFEQVGILIPPFWPERTRIHE